MNRPTDVDAHHLIEHRRVRVIERLRGSGDAGVVHKRRHRTERRIDRGEKCDRCMLVGTVGLDCNRATAGPLYLCDERLGGCAPGPVGERHVVATRGGQSRDSGSDPLTAAGDDENARH